MYKEIFPLVFVFLLFGCSSGSEKKEEKDLSKATSSPSKNKDKEVASQSTKSLVVLDVKGMT